MDIKKKTAIVFGSAGVAFAAMGIIQPHLPNQPEKTPAQVQQEQHRQNLSELSDADETQRSRYRDEGNGLVDADQRDQLRPGERRPPEPPRFRFLPR